MLHASPLTFPQVHFDVHLASPTIHLPVRDIGKVGRDSGHKNLGIYAETIQLVASTVSTQLQL